MFKQRLCQIKIRNQKKLYFLLFDKELSLITLNEDFKHPKWEKFSLLVYDYKNYVGFLNIKDFIELIIDTIKHLLNINITNKDIDFIFIKNEKEFVINLFKNNIQIQEKQYSFFSRIRHFFASIKNRDLPHHLINKMNYERFDNNQYSYESNLIDTIIKINKIILKI